MHGIVHRLNNSHLIEVNPQNSVISLQQQCSGLHCHIWYMYSVYRKNNSEITKVVTKTKVCYRFQHFTLSYTNTECTLVKVWLARLMHMYIQHIQTHMHIHTHKHMYTHIHTHVHTRHKHYTHMHMHTYVHAHVHTQFVIFRGVTSFMLQK